MSGLSLRGFTLSEIVFTLALGFTLIGCSREPRDVGMIAELGNLAHLKRVWLIGTQITDAAVPHFLKLSRIEGLYLPRGVSERGVEELQRAFPDAEIRR